MTFVESDSLQYSKNYRFSYRTQQFTYANVCFFFSSPTWNGIIFAFSFHSSIKRTLSFKWNFSTSSFHLQNSWNESRKCSFHVMNMQPLGIFKLLVSSVNWWFNRMFDCNYNFFPLTCNACNIVILLLLVLPTNISTPILFDVCVSENLKTVSIHI